MRNTEVHRENKCSVALRETSVVLSVIRFFLAEFEDILTMHFTKQEFSRIMIK